MFEKITRREFASQSVALMGAGLATRSLSAQDFSFSQREFAAARAEIETQFISTRGCGQLEPLTPEDLKRSLDFAASHNSANSLGGFAGGIAPNGTAAMPRSEAAASIFGAAEAARLPTQITVDGEKLSPAQTFEFQRAIGNVKKRWRSGEKVTFGFLHNEPVREEMCRKAFRVWKHFSGLQLEEGPNAFLSDIRISFFTNLGNYSLIGTDCRLAREDSLFKTGGRVIEESMNIDDTNQGVVFHEVGHAIGLEHEQMHHIDQVDWNVPAVFAHFATNYPKWTRQMIEQNVLRKLGPNNLASFATTPRRDPASIMQYALPGFLHFNTVGTGPNQVPDKQNAVLSDLDRSFISTFYGHTPDPNTEPDTGTDPTGTGSTGKAVRLVPDRRPSSGEVKAAGDLLTYSFRVRRPGRYRIETTDRGPSVPMLLKLYDSDDLTKSPLAENSYGGERLLNARITRRLRKGTYFVTAQHVNTTANSKGRYRISVSSDLVSTTD